MWRIACVLFGVASVLGPRLHAEVASGAGQPAPAVMVSDDVLGPGPVSEWDDLKTFGFAVSAPLGGPLASEVEYGMMTWRGNGGADASRIDTLRFLADWSLPSMPLGIFRLEPRLAAGVVLAGNLGGALLQEGSHTVLGVARPFPQSYDSLSAVAPAAALSARALWESGSLKAALAGELAGDPLEGLGAKAGITAGIGSGQGSLSVTLAARMDWATGASPTLARVSASESGVTLRVDCVAGYLRGSRQLNVSTGVSNGAVGVQLGGASADRGSALPLALEAAFMATFRGTGQRVLAPVLGRGVRFYASQGGGWWTAVGTDGAGIRYSDYGCGLEGRLLTAMGNLELEAGCALGAHAVFLTAQPLGEARSSILSTTAGAGLRIEPVLRAGILEGGGGERMRKTGLGAGCGFDALLWNIPAPPRQEPFVEVFFFGEAR